MSQTRSIVSSVKAVLGPAAGMDAAGFAALASSCAAAVAFGTEAFLPTFSPRASSRLRTSTFSASTWLMVWTRGQPAASGPQTEGRLT